MRVFCLFIPDLLAVPDFLNGAMEEWGLVVFRRALLVYDEQFTSTDAKVKMTKVIAHELAHQVSPLCQSIWIFLQFGQLVLEAFNPLTPKSDQLLISPYNISPESLIKVTRMKEMITN